MSNTDQQAVEEIVHRGDSLGTRELIDILERLHDDDEAFREVLEERLTDADGWVSESDQLYEVDGDRISQYPAAWHDQLSGERDPAAYLRFFEAKAPAVLSNARGGRQSVNEDADQHPKAGVYLTE